MMHTQGVELKLSILSSADGSTEIKQRGSRVICSVMGPGDVSSSKKLFDRAHVACDFYRLPTSKNSILVRLLGKNFKI